MVKGKNAEPEWGDKGYAFFQNRACEFFPCHRTSRPQEFNCLFCYCPLYALGDRCGGNFSYTEDGVKVCTECMFPHVRANYGRVLDKYPQIKEIAAKKTEK